MTGAYSMTYMDNSGSDIFSYTMMQPFATCNNSLNPGLWGDVMVNDPSFRRDLCDRDPSFPLNVRNNPSVRAQSLLILEQSPTVLSPLKKSLPRSPLRLLAAAIPVRGQHLPTSINSLSQRKGIWPVRKCLTYPIVNSITCRLRRNMATRTLIKDPLY